MAPRASSPASPSAKGGASLPSRPAGRRVRKLFLVILVAVILVTVAGLSAFLLYSSPTSTVSIAVRNAADEDLVFSLTQDDRTQMSERPIDSGSTWRRDFRVAPGTYNFTVEYSFGGGSLFKSKIVKVGVYETKPVMFSLVNLKPIVTPLATLSVSPIADGEKVTIVSVNPTTHWSNVTIQLLQDRNVVEWQPTTEGLTSLPPPKTQALGSKNLAVSRVIWCNVTDILGNGILDVGDYFNLTWSSMYPPAATVCQVGLLFEPNLHAIASTSFNP